MCQCYWRFACGNTNNSLFPIWDGTRFIATWRTIKPNGSARPDQYYVLGSAPEKFQGVKGRYHPDVINQLVQCLRGCSIAWCWRNRYFTHARLWWVTRLAELPVDVRVDVGTAVGRTRLVNTIAGMKSGSVGTWKFVVPISAPGDEPWTW